MTIVERAVRGFELLLQARHLVQQFLLFGLVFQLFQPGAQCRHPLRADLAAQPEQAVGLAPDFPGIAAASRFVQGAQLGC